MITFEQIYSAITKKIQICLALLHFISFNKKSYLIKYYLLSIHINIILIIVNNK